MQAMSTELLHAQSMKRNMADPSQLDLRPDFYSTIGIDVHATLLH